MRTKYEAVAVVGSPIGHVVALWTSYFVAREVSGRKELNFCYDDCFVASGDGVWRGVFQLIRGYEECVGWRVEDTGFMEIRGARVMYQQLKSRVGPENGKEGVVIDEKGFRLGGCWRHQGGSCNWSVGMVHVKYVGQHTATVPHSDD